MTTHNHGTELDALVAETVMGWKRMRWKDFQSDTRESLTYSWHDSDGKMTENAEDCDDYYSPSFAWSPSTDIEAAWQVVERLWDENPHVQFELRHQGTAGGWMARFPAPVLANYVEAKGKTAPHAICLAALRAVGYDPKAMP